MGKSGAFAAAMQELEAIVYGEPEEWKYLVDAFERVRACFMPNIAGGSLPNTRIRQQNESADSSAHSSLPVTHIRPEGGEAVATESGRTPKTISDHEKTGVTHPVEPHVSAVVREAQAWLAEYTPQEQLQYNTPHLVHDLLEAGATVQQKRDEALADAGELEAITSLVSDRSEVGCYAKVEAMAIALEAAEATDGIAVGRLAGDILAAELRAKLNALLEHVEDEKSMHRVEVIRITAERDAFLRGRITKAVMLERAERAEAKLDALLSGLKQQIEGTCSYNTDAESSCSCPAHLMYRQLLDSSRTED